MTTEKKQPWFPASTPDAMVKIRIPLIGWILLSYIATVIIQLPIAWRPHQALLFTALLTVHAVLHWHFAAIVRRSAWLYFALQGFLISLSSFFVPDGGYGVILVSLHPVLMGQCMSVYRTKKQIGVSFMFSYALFCGTVMVVGEYRLLSILLPLYILMTVVVLAVTNLALQQLQTQLRTETFLEELKTAHRRVEELTVAQERQRMARDLHDTLAQGVAGLIMQLEAVDAHLTKGNTERGHEIVRQSMSRARKTLAEARHAIDDLRTKAPSTLDFAEAIQEEAERYEESTGIRTVLDIQMRSAVSRLMTEHCLHIVRECLANAAKHAEAKEVRISVRCTSSSLLMEIRDDGKGFNTDAIGKLAGRYGLTGIQERVRILGGTLQVDSNGRDGTAIRMEAPLGKGGMG